MQASSTKADAYVLNSPKVDSGNGTKLRLELCSSCAYFDIFCRSFVRNAARASCWLSPRCGASGWAQAVRSPIVQTGCIGFIGKGREILHLYVYSIPYRWTFFSSYILYICVLPSSFFFLNWCIQKHCPWSSVFVDC